MSERAAATEFRCGRAARWLPRVLAASVLVATLVATRGARAEQDTRRFGELLVVLGAAAAWLIVRTGSETWSTFRLSDDALIVVAGRSESRIDLARLARVDFESAFARRGRWIPAVALHDEDGTAWRVPALLADGESLVSDLVRRAGRADLAAWASEGRIAERMAYAGRRVALGYVAAVAVVAAAIVHAVRG